MGRFGSFLTPLGSRDNFHISGLGWKMKNPLDSPKWFVLRSICAKFHTNRRSQLFWSHDGLKMKVTFYKLKPFVCGSFFAMSGCNERWEVLLVRMHMVNASVATTADEIHNLIYHM